MTLIILAVLLVLALGAIYAAYLVADRETMNAEKFRDGSGYEIATLSHGATAFRTYGPVSAPAIILVHGATLGSLTYQDYAAPFVAAGFRVVLYDQYGRGFSDRPRAPFSIDLMRAQLAELMDHLEIERAHLYGVSLGGAIVTRFAAARCSDAYSNVPAELVRTCFSSSHRPPGSVASSASNRVLAS